MSLTKKPDGRYVIRFYWDGTKRSERKRKTLPKGTSFAYATARHKELVAAAEARKGGADDSRITFKMLADEYVNVHCAARSDSAKERAERALKLILPHFGARIARSLRPPDIEQYRQRRLADGVKPATVNREWAIIKAILNKAEAWERIERNPIRRGAVPMFKNGPGRLIFFEAEEWKRFLSAFEDEAAWTRYRTKIRNLGPVKLGLQGERRYGGGMKPDSEATAEYRERLRACIPYFKTLLYTGSRPGEVLRLNWQDVDLERRVISIWQGKTSATKTVRISNALFKVLAALPRGIGAVAVFLRPDGHRLTKDDVTRAFIVAKRLSGVRDELTLYSLRHTFASWLAIKGVPIRTIQELLGHKDMRMTLGYAHLSPAHEAEAVEAIEAVENSIGGPPGDLARKTREAESGTKFSELNWWPQRESNPRSGLERAVS